MSDPKDPINLYLSKIPEESKETLLELLKIIKDAAPKDSEITSSYGMPTFKYKGKGFAGVAASKEHCGFYPFSPAVIQKFLPRLEKYETSKGTVRFPIGSSLPKTVLKEMIKARLEEIEK